MEDQSECTPGQCHYESKTLQMGRSTKSLCVWRGREIWTTCRDWDRCTFLKDQMPLFDVDDDDDGYEGDE